LKFDRIVFLVGVIPSEADLQAERGISLCTKPLRGRSLGPLVKARAFGMTPPNDKIQTASLRGGALR